MPAQQLSLQLASPLDHHETLHPRPVGETIYWLPDTQHASAWKKVAPGNLPPLIDSDLTAYLTPNEFATWRRIDLLRALTCCYVDIDEHGIGPREIAERLKRRGLPLPSLVIYTGRGTHAYWLLEQASGRALPVWQGIQNKLIDALGGDPAARDAARVLRVLGSKASEKGAAPVVTGEIMTGERWSLHALADAVLGERWKSGKAQTPNVDRKAGVRDLQPRRGYRHGLGVYQRWHRVYEDLIRIADHHGGHMPEGHRQTWLFLAAVALSWFVHPTALEDEVRQLAAARVPGIDWQQEHPRTALRRAQASADGDTVEWMGRQVDPRYRFRRSTLWRWCEGMVPAELVDDLRAIIPDEIARQRKDAGRWERSTKTRRVEHLPTVQRLAHDGLSQRQIARETGIPRRTVADWLRRS